MKFFSCATTALYLIAILSLQPPQFDAYSAFGSGDETIGQHCDGAHCAHIPLSHLQCCTVCSNTTGKNLTLRSSYLPESGLANEQQCFIFVSSPRQTPVYIPISRRGPPESMTIA